MACREEGLGMANDVNTIIKVKNADREGLDQFIAERFTDVFSSAKAKHQEKGKIAYKGGSLMKPYGFKAVSTVQIKADDTAIVKLWGRPKMYPMAYIALLMLIGGVVGIIIDPVQNAFLGILIVLFLFILRREQKNTNKKIIQILDEVKIKYS